MDRTEEESAQIASWFREQGLSPGASADEQLCFLWKTLQRAQGNLCSLNQTLDSQRSQYAAEISDVRKSLERIRVFTGHKDVLAQEIQDENDQLRDQLRRLVSLQDLQISEVAKMLYDQGLTELVHSSPSEQVAYLLVERASLLETSEGFSSTGQDRHVSGTGGQTCTSGVGQPPHKRALRHSQSPWRKLLGLHKNQKYLLIPAESKHLAEQTNSVQKECFRLERDLEEGSKRLATAHNEIRRLTDELESAQKIHRAYEPELKAAKHEVDQLRQVVQQLKKYEIMTLRKAKEQNDCLAREIQCLRSRQRATAAEEGVAQQTKLLSVQVQTDPTFEPEEVALLQTEVEKLQSALQEQQTSAEKAKELKKTLEAEVSRNNEVCQNLQGRIDAQMKRQLQQESEMEALKLELENCQRENKLLEQKQLDVSLVNHQPLQSPENHPNSAQKLHDCDSAKDVCKFLKKEICETQKCFDQEQRRYHETHERLKLKLRHVKLKLKDETEWRDEKIEELERESSLRSHALNLEKELNMNIMMENDKLLIEKRRLVQQLNEEAKNSHKNISTALQSRIDFLEMENRELQNRIVDLSAQISSLERSLQNIQSLRAAEELKNTCDLPKTLTQLPAQTSCLPLPDVACRTCSSLYGAETWSQCSSLARSGEMGYLNLNSSHSRALLNTADS